MVAEDGVTGLAALVPEVYFDLISRVPPGLLVLVIFLSQVAVGIDDQRLLASVTANWAVAAGLLSLALGASYVIGLLLTPIGAYVSRPISHFAHKRCFKRHGVFIESFCSKEQIGSIKDGKIRFWDFYKFARGYLNAEQSHTRNILSKMHAEYALCNNMIAAILVTLIGLMLTRWLNLIVAESSLVRVFLLPLLAISSIAAWHRYNRALDRHITCLRLALAMPKKSNEQPAENDGAAASA